MEFSVVPTKASKSFRGNYESWGLSLLSSGVIELPSVSTLRHPFLQFRQPAGVNPNLNNSRNRKSHHNTLYKGFKMTSLQKSSVDIV